MNFASARKESNIMFHFFFKKWSLFFLLFAFLMAAVFPSTAFARSLNPLPPNALEAQGSVDLNYNMSAYCDKIQNLKLGNFPIHLYMGPCLINKIKSGSWATGLIETVVDKALCEDNLICGLTVKLLAFFIHGEIDHIADESDQCGGKGVYIYALDPDFHTYSVC
jgi:hypothetical protein